MKTIEHKLSYLRWKN